MQNDGNTVLLPQPIGEEAQKYLEEKGINILLAGEPKPESVAPLIKRAKAIVLRTGIAITRDLIDQADELLTISRTGGGVDNVDMDYATKKGIIVTSSLGINTSSVVEHCIALITALFKQLFLMDREVRKKNYAVRYKNIPRDLAGKTLGIAGFGRIGSELARTCHTAFKMNILAFDKYLPEEAKRELDSWVRFTGLKEVFGSSDVVSIHLPLTEETKELIDFSYFSLMKPGAFLINTSRGGVINEKDLIRALSESLIAGAGLDVLEKEPPDEDNPLLKMKNVILTPHSAALTAECVNRMAVEAARRVIDVLDGFIPPNIANPEVLKHKRWESLKERNTHS